MSFQLKFLVEVLQAFIACIHHDKVITWVVHRLKIDVMQNLDKNIAFLMRFCVFELSHFSVHLCQC